MAQYLTNNHVAVANREAAHLVDSPLRRIERRELDHSAHRTRHFRDDVGESRLDETPMRREEDTEIFQVDRENSER